MSDTRGALQVAVGLLREVVGPLEVSAAVIEDEDGGEAIESLIDKVKQYVNDFDRAALAAPAAVEREDALRKALNAMLTHMGMDEDEWNKPTFDQARKALALTEQPSPAQCDGGTCGIGGYCDNCTAIRGDVLIDAERLHAAIIELPCEPDPRGSELFALSYRQGHRDARHAAEELALKGKK